MGRVNPSCGSTGAAPPLSIGMPVYNGARFLPCALDSLLGQTFGDFELIVSDNASTDGTEEIVRGYAARDGRIRYVRHTANQGAAWNFNHAFELARAACFKWAAADDVCDRSFLARCIDVLRQEPSVVCCHSRTRKIDEAGTVLEHLDDPTDGGLPSAWFAEGRRARHRPDASSPIPHLRFRDVLMSSGWAVRCSGVIRSDMLRQTCLIQPYYGYEKVTMAELALRGRFYDVPETLFFQREHAEASSRLATAAAQQKFFAAGPSSKKRHPRFQLLRGHLRAVSQAPIGAYQRLRCRGWLLRYLVQLHKWPQVLRAAALGLGVGSRPPAPPAGRSQERPVEKSPAPQPGQAAANKCAVVKTD